MKLHKKSMYSSSFNLQLTVFETTLNKKFWIRSWRIPPFPEERIGFEIKSEVYASFQITWSRKHILPSVLSKGWSLHYDPWIFLSNSSSQLDPNWFQPVACYFLLTSSKNVNLHLLLATQVFNKSFEFFSKVSSGSRGQGIRGHGSASCKNRSPRRNSVIDISCFSTHPQSLWILYWLSQNLFLGW